MSMMWLGLAAAFATLGLIFAYIGARWQNYRFSRAALLYVLAGGVCLFVAVVKYSFF